MRHRWITLLEEGDDVFRCLPVAVILGEVEPDDECPGCLLKIKIEIPTNLKEPEKIQAWLDENYHTGIGWGE